MTTTLEALPDLVLDRICQFLDDQSATRRSLRAFSIVSRSCHIGAAAQWYSQIQVKIRKPDALKDTLARWNSILGGGRHLHVRRLKISLASRRHEPTTLPQNEVARFGEDGYLAGGWNVRPYFNMHNFCRPLEASLREWDDRIDEDDIESWAPLGQFVSQFTGLRDLIWAAGWFMPLSVLSSLKILEVGSEKAIEGETPGGLDGKRKKRIRTRLHHHSFQLRSLMQDRDNPQPISATDYTLCTSPYLYSIVAQVGYFESGGLVNYAKEALLEMISSLAPKLTHVCWVVSPLPVEILPAAGFGGPKPAWRGLFPGSANTEGGTDSDSPVSGGRLESLLFPQHVPKGIAHWASVKDLCNLHCLLMRQIADCSSLAEIASRGDLRSLQKLRLHGIFDGDEQSQQELHLFLSSMSPLQQLDLQGYISPETFDVIVRCQGESLRILILDPYNDSELGDPSTAFLVFTRHFIWSFASIAHHLRHLEIPMDRTRGDTNEVGCYRALSKFSCLEHIRLSLQYSVGPEVWDENIDGVFPAFPIRSWDIPFHYFRDALTNAAMDATLAKAIFELTSSNGTLQHLDLCPTLIVREGPNIFEVVVPSFQNAVRWFGRPWLVTRDSQGEILARELEKEKTARCGDFWVRCLDIGSRNPWYEKCEECFKRIWPPKSADWDRSDRKNDWESLPLDLGEEME